MKSDQDNLCHTKWKEIIKEYLTSKMTQKLFCEKRNISLPQFVYYYGQYRRENASKIEATAFLPVKITQHENLSIASEIRLSLPNGFQCVFPSHIDTVQIKRLVEVLLSC